MCMLFIYHSTLLMLLLLYPLSYIHTFSTTTTPNPLYQGQSSPWNIGMAYRIPDTSINLSGSYQQGKGNLQLSCVPDESLPLLGPNGEYSMYCVCRCCVVGI